MKVVREVASTAILVSAVIVVRIADRIAPRATVRFMQRYEPQLDRFVQFLLGEEEEVGVR
ncbi:MAG: hypothetical protein WC348_03035 [Patescibacteria group bacterium]